MHEDSKENKEKSEFSGFNQLKNIPIVAIIFPPIGILMLLKYFLNNIEHSKKDDHDG